MAIGIGISIANNRVGTSAPSLGSTMATTHYNRVIADGGVVPAGISGLTTILDLVVAAYGATSSSDFNTKVPVFLDPHYTGYKLGAGSGTTLGQAARTVYAISSTADVTQATAASQPLLLAHSGTNYWWSPAGISGNMLSTPHSSANNITGDITVIVRVNLRLNASTLYLGSKWGSQNCWLFSIASNTLQFGVGLQAGGTSFVNATANYPNFNTLAYIKVNRIASTGVVTFSTSIDGITYTQLGTTVNTTAGNIATATTQRIDFGGTTSSIGMDGSFYLGQLYDSSNTLVNNCNPASYSASTSQTSWTSSTGEVWTINTGTATTGYKGVMVDRTILQGDGIDDGLLTSGTISLPTVFTLYSAFKGYNNEAGNGKVVFGKQNIDGAVTRYSATNLAGWIGSGGSGSVVQQTATVANLNLATFKRKVSSNTLQVNNGTIATSINSNAIANSSITLFSVTTYGFCNGLFSTGLVSSLEDDTTQKTALYNTIRSMNNNAF